MSRRNSAYTLVEIIIVVLVVAVLITVAFTLLFQGRRRHERLTSHLVAAQEGRLGMERMTREIREGHRIFYPAPGKKSQPGVGFVNAEGKAIFYCIDAPGAEAAADGRLYELKRIDANDDTTTVIARGVKSFRATVPSVEAGREPALVHLYLTLSTGSTGRIKKEALQSYVTSVFLRAADARCTEWGPVR